MLTRLIEAGVKSVTSASIEMTNVDREIQKHNDDAEFVGQGSNATHDDRY